MTGFASASTEASETGANSPGGGPSAGPALTVEARSVNGRFLDIAFRMPDELRSLEPALREMLAGALKRGKVEMRVATAREAGDGWPAPTSEQLHRLSALQSTVQNWLPQARDLSVNEAMNWCRGAAPAARLDEAALAAAKRCVEGLREARAREGERLVATLLERTGKLRELVRRARPLVPEVVRRQQQRFVERFHEALAAAGGGGTVSEQALQERALGEAAAYALRIDVAEELERLVAHLDEIERLLAAGGELGKRLDFLIQELHREANTLGSKAAALELTGISVEMKVLIEQMREQVQNLE